jgi:hypothetical protein
MIVSAIALIVAICLSGVAEYFSIQGLTTLFVGAYWPVTIMGVVLGAGKLVAASWVQHNWPVASVAIRSYLIAAICVLSVITDVGVYGFLAKAHIEHVIVANIGNVEQIQLLEAKVSGEKTYIDDEQTQIDAIDKAIESLVKNDRASLSLREQLSQRKTRQALVDSRNKHLTASQQYSEELIAARSKVSQASADAGPLLYVAQLLFSENSQAALDKTVRYLIVVIVSVFDPLAIVLLLAANSGLQKKLTLPGRSDIVVINPNILSDKDRS